MEEKTAIIFGVTGQDGSYLSSFLLEKGYTVVGVVRRASTDNTGRLGLHKEHDNFILEEGDILDPGSVNEVIGNYQPAEVYNLAAQSHVATSFKQPAFTFQVNAVGVLNILEAIRGLSPDSRLYQASTSEMFGNNYSQRYLHSNEIGCINLAFPPNNWHLEDSQLTEEELKVRYMNRRKYQDEETPFSPRSPYAVAKMAAHNLCFTYRQSYNIFASCGILFNHESEVRGKNFVTRKISSYVAGLVNRRWFEMGSPHMKCRCFGPNEVESLALGNLDSKRDWGHAEDYVRAMWMMLQQDKPDDFVVATGKAHSVRQFLDEAFGYVGITDWAPYVFQDPEFYRPAEVDFLLGDATKAKKVLGWTPEISFKELVERMVENDIREAQEERP